MGERERKRDLEKMEIDKKEEGILALMRKKRGRKARGRRGREREREMF